VVVLLLLVFGAWGPRSSTTTAPAPPEPGRRPAPALDVEDVVERARHGITAHPGGELTVTDDAYGARFDRGGFSFAPAGTSVELTVSLASLSRGGVTTTAEPRAWTARENVAERRVGADTVERVTARDGEVEWDVVLDREPAGAGPLTVTGRLDGVSGRTGTGIRLDDGSTVDLGDLVVKDARGATVHRARPTIDGAEIRLEVPAAVLDGAAYPLTLDPTVSGPVPVSGTFEHGPPSVAWSGSAFMIVWEQVNDGESNVLGAVVDADGLVVEPATFLTSSIAHERAPDVTYSNSGVFTVVYQYVDQFDPPLHRVHAMDVRSDMLVVDHNVVDGGDWVMGPPSIASTGSQELVTWHDNRSGRSFDIRARRLFTSNPDGDTFTVFGEPASFPVVADQVDPDVAWNGTVFAVAWREGGTSSVGDVYATRVSGAGTALTTTTVSAGSHQETDPQIASDGANFLVVWRDDRNGDVDVYGTRLDGAGNVLGSGVFPVVQRAGQQAPFGLAHNGTYLVVWRDSRNGNADVFAGRVDGAGRVLDGTGFPVATATVEENFPAVSRGGGSTWGVVDKQGIRSSAVIEWRRVSPK
jgi:hypothetical protein